MNKLENVPYLDKNLVACERLPDDKEIISKINEIVDWINFQKEKEEFL